MNYYKHAKSISHSDQHYGTNSGGESRSNTTDYSYGNDNENVNKMGGSDIKKSLMRELPLGIEEDIPEAKMYNDLLDLDKCLDYMIVNKQMAIYESSFKPSRLQKILKVYLSNFVSDQHWQTSDSTQNQDPSAFTIPSWTFRIEGYLYDHINKKIVQIPNYKFSHFVKSIVVEIPPVKGKEHNNTSLQEPCTNICEGSHLFEWTRSPLSSQVDGFEIKRNGDISIDVKIYIKLNNLVEKYKVSPCLYTIIYPHKNENPHGYQTDTKSNIYIRFWKYILSNQLYNAEKRLVMLDEVLANLFKCEFFTVSQMFEKLSIFLSPPDPIVLDYTICVEETFTQGFKEFDLIVEVPDMRVKSLIAMPLEIATDINFLDKTISNVIQLIFKSYQKRKMLNKFSEDPNAFIWNWLENASREYDMTVFDGSKIPLDEMRRSRFYKGDWVKEAIFHYTNSKTQ